MRLSLATLLLITPCDAVQIKNRAGSLPEFPVSGQDIVQAAIKGLDMVPIKELMHTQQTECRSNWDENIKPGSPEDDCNTWDDGLWDEINDLNRDLKRDGERFGLYITDANLYDPEFIIQFVEAEYHDFVKEFKNAQDHIAKGIDYGLSELQKELSKLGLAQIKAKIRSSKDGKDDRDEGPDKYACYNEVGKIREEKERACTDRSEWPSVCNRDWCGPRGCKEVDWSKCQDKDSHEKPECNDRDITPDEQKAFDIFQSNEQIEWENNVIACYLKTSPLSAQLADEMAKEGLTKEAFVEMFKMGADELTNFVNGPELPGLIKEGIEQINGILESESSRLNVTMPTSLPDPADTSEKLAGIISAEVAREIERNSLDSMALEMYRDIIQEAHNIEFEMEHGGDFNIDPRRLQRDIAKGARELGIDIDAGKTADFVAAVADDVKGLKDNTQFHEELKKLGEEAVREAEHAFNELKR